MGGGTSIRSQQPANFARESNPASRLVKILLKHYIRYKRAIYKRQERTHRLEPHSLKTISRKETTVQPPKATEGSSEKKDTHTQAKPTQSPTKPQYSQQSWPRRRIEREDTHSCKNLRVQYSQQRWPRETHSNHTKKDRNEKSHQRPYWYGHWLPIGVGENGAFAETENV